MSTLPQDHVSIEDGSDTAHHRLSRRQALQLTAAAGLASVGGVTRPAWSQPVSPTGRNQSFNSDWLFLRDDAQDAQAVLFDDRTWRRIDVPHDWSIEDLDSQTASLNSVIRAADTEPVWAPLKNVTRVIGPFEDAPPAVMIASSRSAGGRNTGYVVGGIGWYRKRFRLPALAADARVELTFDGIYGASDIWLNGEHIASNVNGYTPITVDLTPHLNLTSDNVLAVRVANVGMNSRWYSGSGIYRSVKMDVIGPARFARYGVRATVVKADPAGASVAVRIRTEGVRPGCKVEAILRDQTGRVVARADTAAGAETVLNLTVARPRLWSPDKPFLYKLECVLTGGTDVLDTVTTPVGLRTIMVSAQTGLLINGKPVKLRGGCVHHDNGILGAVAIDRAEERKVELLKARGFNAVRTSHNPVSTAFLDACDRLGMFVIEEAFDMWEVPKRPDDYHLYFRQHGQRDLATMIERDANHPSIIMWSIGNEIPEKDKAAGVEIARKLVAEARRLDPTRPITEGINGWAGPAAVRADGTPDQAVTQFLDVAGYNYNHKAYEKDHVKFPSRVLVGTESFPKDADTVWRLTERNSYLIGDFVWTAMDYLGEAGIGMVALEQTDPFQSSYPWINAFCGDIDLIGQQKPQSLLRDVVWGVQPLTISVERPLPGGKKPFISAWGWGDELQSWTWPGHDGKPVRVRTFTRGDRVVLTLNGRVVGEKALTDADGSEASFSVPYAPGTLVASAYRGGKLIGRRTLETAGAPAGLRVTADRRRIAASRSDLAFVTVEVIDAKGRVVPDEVRVLETKLSGPVEIAAFGNANPRGVASFKQPVAKTWHGRALAVIRPTGGPGSALLEVRSDGIASAVMHIELGRP